MMKIRIEDIFNRLYQKIKKAAQLFITVLLTATMNIPTAHALFPFPREGQCDPAIFTPFPDFNTGPGTLKGFVLPEDPKLAGYIRDKDAAILLGKALFWDMQVGSDGVQACGSCHFRAGADSRSKNQLSPGGKNDITGVIDQGGANGQLTNDQFPFMLFSDKTDRDSTIVRQSDDVVSSQGVHRLKFLSVKRGAKKDKTVSLNDPVFSVQGLNVRRVEPRNTPTMINAALFNKNFWDGRANNLFNGVNAFGAGDENARVLKATGRKGKSLVPVKVRLDFSSLASQAVDPIVSADEMSAVNRPLRDIGKRIVNARALAGQEVHADDSVLGSFKHRHKKGLKMKYKKLIRAAFKPMWWRSKTVVEVDTNGNETYKNRKNHKQHKWHNKWWYKWFNNGHKKRDELKDNQYTLMEYNFGLFFGLAVQEYEKTLISDDAKIDQHFDNLAQGHPGLLSEQELRGEEIFEAASCADCHSGAEFTSASVRTSRTGFENPEVSPSFQPPEWIERMFNGNCDVIVYEQGFYNIGVRPIAEDLGVGANDPFGNPLSAANIVTANPEDIPSAELLTYEYANIANPPIGPGTDRTIMEGAFKIPSLRNVELTAPYFHTGGQSTLRQVVEFYNRGGDFHELNNDNMDFEVGKLGLTEDEIDDLVAFLKTLTDERVRDQKAPFDHPEIRVPNGSVGNSYSVTSMDGAEAVDEFIVVPAVGRNGGPLEPAFLE